MKKRNTQNSNGISISDSIVMSVKQKNANPRKPFSVAITLMGFISVIMSFFGMFDLNCNTKAVFFWGLAILAFYITLSVKGGKALYIYAVSCLFFLFAAYKKLAVLVDGYKFIYNVIYKTSFSTRVNYYKKLKYILEVPSVTTLIIFYMWLLAMIICFFTICRPNPVLPLLVTFPVLEIGMYNGIEVPIFWGMLCIAYWLALLAMSTIDVGEYSGGQSGFVRKNNLFFPKRHMKLKVTEKCGMLMICSVMTTALLAAVVMRFTDYHRSDSLNQKRIDIADAVEDFSFNNLWGSLERLSAALGFNFESNDHKLGENSRIRYKNITDLTVTISYPVTCPIYLKGDVNAIYKDNKWDPLPPSAYKSELYTPFNQYNVHPQDLLPSVFAAINKCSNPNRIHIITGPRNSKNSYSPYCIINSENNVYTDDTMIQQSGQKKGESTYTFVSDNLLDIICDMSQRTKSTFYIGDILDQEYMQKIMDYSKENGLMNNDGIVSFETNYPLIIDERRLNPQNLLTLEMQDRYNRFAYENYLRVPDNKAMREVREEFSDVLNVGEADTPAAQIEILNNIKYKLADMCDYTLNPGKTPYSEDFVNHFLLKSKKGFCAHFASSGVLLARMAGIPARYATGYVILEKDINAGKTNYDGSVTINVKDNRKHAWAEVYLIGTGWVPFEFTADRELSDDTDEPSSQTTSPNKTTTTKATTTTSSSGTVSASQSSATSLVPATTTVTSTSKAAVARHHLPKPVRTILVFMLLIASAVAFILIRRRLILDSRDKKLSARNTSERVINIYSYAEKLLTELNQKCKYGNYKSFASKVEKWYGGVYFNEGDFEKLTDIALRTRFGNTVPTEEEAELCLKTVKQLSETIYDKSDRMHKLRLTYISVLK